MSTGQLALVLLSGGVDSTACVAFYKRQGYSVEGLFIEYGQSAAAEEQQAATRVASFYEVSLHHVTCVGMPGFGVGLIHGRNSFLLATALMFVGGASGTIATGIHAHMVVSEKSGGMDAY